MPRNKKTAPHITKTPRPKLDKPVLSGQQKYDKKQRQLSNTSLTIVPLGKDYSTLTAAETLVFWLMMSSVLRPTDVNAKEAKNKSCAIDSADCEIRPQPTYFGLSPRDVTAELKNCTPKYQGVSPGKFCFLGEDKYILKPVNYEDNHYTRLSSLQRMYGNHLIRDNVGIKVPELSLVYEKNGTFTNDYGEKIKATLYSASKFIKGFVASVEFKGKYQAWQLFNFFNKELTKEEQRRNILIDQIGEKGIANLFVVNTFLCDILTQPENWGAVANELVIIDTDCTYFPGLPSYQSIDINMQNARIALSLDTVQQMSEIYEKMLDKSPPKFDPQVDLQQDLYQSRIKSCLFACQNTLQSPPDKLNFHQPSFDVNQAWLTHLGNALQQNNCPIPKNI